MRRKLTLGLITIAVCAAACGGCDDDPNNGIPASDAGTSADDGSNTGDMQADSGGRAGPDMGTDDGGSSDDAGVSEDAGDGDTGTGDDAGTTDAGMSNDAGMTDTSVCGDDDVEGPEICDDGNTDGGDYCAADCSAETGRCGDGTLQSNESCDDGVTTDCMGTHDGGDGVCVPTSSCSNGFSLNGNGVCVSTNTTGLPTPCSNGTGQTLFRFHYDSGSTSARVDVWDASCSYSFAPNSACNVREVYPGFGDVDRTSQGYPVLSSTEYIRVRYSVSGISFSQATLYVQARSYSTGASTNIEAWSPIYGGIAYGPVDNDFVYDWYAIDWSNSLSPSDDPNLTAIQLYAHQGSNSLAVKAVELCLQ